MLPAQFKAFFIKHRYIILLGLVWLVLVIFNYKPGTYLTGYDNLHPEFDFKINFERNFNVVWQEFQGLGVLGGMSHASDIPRMLLLLVLSTFLNSSALRYAWTLGMLLFGAVGTYKYIREIVTNRRDGVAFFGALFYMLNLATMQTMYTALDGFVTHLGFLPWLLLFASKFLYEKKYRHLFIFLVLSVFGANQAYTATLILGYIIFLVVLCIDYIFKHKFTRHAVKQVAVLGCATFLINAFWALPVSYFIATKSDVVPNSIISRLSSEESFLYNKVRGSFQNVIQLKGFWFDTTEYFLNDDKYDLMLRDWEVHLDKTPVRILSYVFSGLIIYGFIIAFTKSSYRVYAAFFFVSVFFLMGTNPPFGFIFGFLQSHVPIFAEALRFPFTKFSIVASFSYSILFALSIGKLSRFARRLKFMQSGVILYSGQVFIFVLLIIYALPSFQGYLINPNIRLTIPVEYFDTFAWFKEGGHDGRILSLPMNTHWAWPQYSWGYRGSGFLWYGISNPILERAFDVWGTENETAYWEISSALYSEDTARFKNTLDKYGVRYLLVDKNRVVPTISTDSDQLRFDYTQQLLNNDPSFALRSKNGEIYVYEYLDGWSSDSYVGASRSLANVQAFTGQTTDDSIYASVGNYVSGNGIDKVYFPFASLTSVSSRDFELSEDSDSFVLVSPQEIEEGDTVSISAPKSGSDVVFAVSGRLLSPTRLELTFVPVQPKVYVGSDEVNTGAETFTKILDSYNNINREVYISINGSLFGPIGFNYDPKNIGLAFMALNEDQEVNIYSSSASLTYDAAALLTGSNFDTCSGYEQGYFEYTTTPGQLTLITDGNNACLFRKIKREDARDYLYVFSSDISSNLARPRFCVYSSVLDRCLNNQELAKGDQGTIYSATEISESSGGDLSLYLYLDSYVSKTDDLRSSVTYTNPLLKTYSQLFSGSINLVRSGPDVYERSGLSGQLVVHIPRYKDVYGVKHEDFEGQEGISVANFCATVQGNASSSVVTSGFGSNVRLSAKSSNNCYSFIANDLIPNSPYILSFDHKHLTGEGVHFCLTDISTGKCLVADKLDKSNDWVRETYVYPASNSPDFDGLSMSIENLSIFDKTETEIDNILFHPFPLDYVANIRVTRGSSLLDVQPASPTTLNAGRVYPYFYKIPSIDADSGFRYLLLNQSFDSGWYAYSPGNNLIHLKLNSWANAWYSSTDLTGPIYILYVPQVLGYVGIFLSLSSLLYVFASIKRVDRGTNHTQNNTP